MHNHICSHLITSCPYWYLNTFCPYLTSCPYWYWTTSCHYLSTSCPYLTTSCIRDHIMSRLDYFMSKSPYHVQTCFVRVQTFGVRICDLTFHPWPYPDSMDQTRFEGRTIEVRMYRGWIGHSVQDSCNDRCHQTLLDTQPFLHLCGVRISWWICMVLDLLNLSWSFRHPGNLVAEWSSSLSLFVINFFSDIWRTLCWRLVDLRHMEYSLCCVPGQIPWVFASPDRGLLSECLGSAFLLFESDFGQFNFVLNFFFKRWKSVWFRLLSTCRFNWMVSQRSQRHGLKRKHCSSKNEGRRVTIFFRSLICHGVVVHCSTLWCVVFVE